MSKLWKSSKSLSSSAFVSGLQGGVGEDLQLRPHLAQVLRVWRFRDGGLTHVADYPGLTNHKIGWDFIPGGIRHCGDAPEMITAVSGWSQVAATRFRDSTLASEAIRPYRGPEDLNAALACP